MRMIAGIVGLVLALVLAGCDTHPRAASTTASPPSPPAGASANTPATVGSSLDARIVTRAHDRSCAPKALRLSVVQVSEATQQESRDLRLKNASSNSCHLVGYPTLSLISTDGRRLRVRYVHTGDQMVTNARPHIVDIAPAHHAWVRINQTVCAGRPQGSPASTVRLAPPGSTTFLAAATGRDPLLDYCGPHDAGSTMHVSPVEPTELDTSPLSTRS